MRARRRRQAFGQIRWRCAAFRASPVHCPFPPQPTLLALALALARGGEAGTLTELIFHFNVSTADEFYSMPRWLRPWMPNRGDCPRCAACGRAEVNPHARE